MFKQLGVPLLGIVENMSVFIPPDMPGKKYEIFGKGGGLKLAKENDLPLLAQIPIEIPLVDDSNKGNTKSLIVRIIFLSSTKARVNTLLSLATSEGWKEKMPKFSHLWAPETEIPKK